MERNSQIKKDLMGYKVKAVIGVVAILSVGVLYALEFRWFDRTINMPLLVKYALLLGAVVGIAIGGYLQKGVRQSVEKMQLFLLAFSVCLLITPLLASLTNRLLSQHPTQSIAVEFVDEEGFYADRTPPIIGEDIKPTAYYLFFYYEDGLRRIKNKNRYIRGAITRGDTIYLPIRKGLWGFDLVTHEILSVPE
jgi:hypothetical protein